MTRWTIRIEKRASKELAALQPADRERVLRFLRERLAERQNPRELGQALAGPLSGLWKYRVGSIRLFAKIDDAAALVMVARIGDRREVYR